MPKIDRKLQIWHKQLDEKALAASPAPSELDDEDQDELDQSPKLLLKKSSSPKMTI